MEYQIELLSFMSKIHINIQIINAQAIITAKVTNKNIG